MPKGTSYASSVLALIFNATTFTNVAVNATSSPITSIFASLHVGTPGAGGNQSTNETTYTSYARVGVTRTSGGWTVTSNVVNPVAAITFPAGTGGSGTVDFFGLGSVTSGAGVLFYFGAVSPTIATGNGVTPSLSTATSVTET